MTLFAAQGIRPRRGLPVLSYPSANAHTPKEPLNKSLVAAALVFRDELREASRVEWLFTFARRATRATAKRDAGAPASKRGRRASPPLPDPATRVPRATLRGAIARKTAPRNGLHDKMPICCVALLGIVVRPRSAEQAAPKRCAGDLCAVEAPHMSRLRCAVSLARPLRRLPAKRGCDRGAGCRHPSFKARTQGIPSAARSRYAGPSGNAAGRRYDLRPAPRI